MPLSTSPPTYAEFVDAFPLFDSYDSDIVGNQIEFSSNFLSVSTWGDYFWQAVCLDTAHNLILTPISSDPQEAMKMSGGPVQSVSGAGVSVSFGGYEGSVQGSAADAWYAKTIYGQQFLRLRNNIIPAGVMAV